MPASGDLPKVSSSIPVNELLLRPHPRSLFKKRGRQFIHRAPFIHLNVPSTGALPQFPQSGTPMRRDARLQSLLYISLRVPARKPPLQVPFTELPQSEWLHPQSPFQPITKSPVEVPTQGCPTEPPEERCPSPEPSFITFRVPGKGAPLQVPLKGLP